MTEDTNYTVVDDDEEPAALAGDAVVRPRSRELVIAVILCVSGVAVIALAAWCATAQVTSFSSDGTFARGDAWVVALTLPLSIVGALLLVAGALVGMARYWALGRDAAVEPVPVELGEGTDVGADELGT